MRKTLLVVCLITVIVIAGSVFAASTMIRPDETQENEMPKYGYFYYNGNAYAVRTEEQRKIIDEYEFGHIPAGDVLVMLGEMDESDREKERTLKAVEKALSKLSKDASQSAIVSTLDQVLGGCDEYGGSGIEHYVYNIPGEGSIVVSLGSARWHNEDSSEQKVIFVSGMGFKAEGWTFEEHLEYLESTGLPKEEADKIRASHEKSKKEQEQ